MSAKNTKTSREPSAASLQEMPEVRDWSKAKRGKLTTRFPSDAHAVVIDPALWPHFGSSDAVNEALRVIVRAAIKTKRRGHAA